MVWNTLVLHGETLWIVRTDGWKWTKAIFFNLSLLHIDSVKHYAWLVWLASFQPPLLRCPISMHSRRRLPHVTILWKVIINSYLYFKPNIDQQQILKGGKRWYLWFALFQIYFPENTPSTEAKKFNDLISHLKRNVKNKKIDLRPVSIIRRKIKKGKLRHAAVNR